MTRHNRAALAAELVTDDEARAIAEGPPHLPAQLGGPWRAAAGAYLVEVAQRTGSARTPEEYGRYLARFLAGVADPAKITPAEVQTFAYGVGASGRAPSASTVSVRLAAVRGFLEFCRRMNMLERNPAEHITRPRHPAPTPRGLNTLELRRLLAATPATTGGERDRAAILTAVLTGLRRAEVLGIRAGDLERDPTTGETTYRVRAKGGYERHRELPAPALEAIRGSLAARGETLEAMPADAPLFPISSQGFYRNLRRYGSAAGLGNVTPHALRHSAAKLRRETGASIEDVGALLGHRSLHTTARYLARLEGEHDEGWRAAAALLGV